jgi:predicted DNA-binding transcriptional regulator AlpA
MVTDSPGGNTPDRLITERLAAEILGISADTLRRLNRRGEGPTRRKISPRRVGYKVSEVEAYRDGKLKSEGLPEHQPAREWRSRRRREPRRGKPR